ncbi:MAG TPA: hypothetical protein VLT33_25770 [Labilithrix sp.]|nr:hypothetical protein [Labilithrix sp.]
MGTAAKPPPHAARSLVWAYGAFGVVLLALGVLALATGSVAAGVLGLACGGGALSLARSLQIRIPAAQIVNTAAQHLTRGQIPETEALLGRIAPAAARDSLIARAVAILRAVIALYEGRMAEAESFATLAIERRLGVTTRAFERQQITAAHAVRALARAARGDEAAARKDADVAESSVDATPEVIARARLVRALLASRAAYHEEAFRSYLASNARLVLEHAMPRERALFRALRRMSRSPDRGVYREAARGTNDRAPSPVASWIATLSPEAAPFAAGDAFVDAAPELPVDSVVPSDVRALRTARASLSAARPSRRPARAVGLLALLAVFFVGAWLALTPGGATLSASELATAEAGAPASSAITLYVDLASAAIFVALLVIAVSMGQRRQRALAIARRLMALGDRERALPMLASLAKGRNGIIAASAGLELARLAAHDARFAEAISFCDAAVARVQKQPHRAAATDILLPTLFAESAVAMAARGGTEEAAAELAVLARDFPTYSQLATAELRVRFMSAVRGADRGAAYALARARTMEMPLPYREDVLADLVLASRGQLSEDELARLDGELLDDPALRTWLDLVAPGLREDRPLRPRAV